MLPRLIGVRSKGCFLISTCHPQCDHSGNTTILPHRRGIITDLQESLLRSVSKVGDSSYFYLTGGTALAEFYLGHRKSFDLDLFTGEKRLVLPFSFSMEKKLAAQFDVKVVRRFETFCEFELRRNAESVRLQLAYDSPFRFREPVETDLGMRVNDYDDIIVDKLLAFFGRKEARDAIDVFFILQTEDFWTLVEQARKKDPGFDLYWFAIVLAEVRNLPDELSSYPVEMILDVDIRQMKSLFALRSKEVIDRIKPSSR